MRPDQHKKKRSAQYKKKHGMAKDASKEGKKETLNTGAPSSRAGAKTSETDAAGGRSIPSKSVPDSWSSEDDVGNEHQPGMSSGRSFKRREIASNWERYEGVDVHDSEEEQLRGADFRALLAATSNAMSQFRFQDEKEWVIDDSSTMSDVLTLNPDDIAACLECLPLHQRLDIEKEVFDEKDVHRYEEIAAANRLVYKPPYSVSTTTTAGEVPAECVTSLQNKLIEGLKDQKQDASDSSSESDGVLDDILDFKDLKEQPGESCEIENTGQHSSDQAQQNSDCEKNKLMEQIWDKESDILDDLLHMTDAKPATGTSLVGTKTFHDDMERKHSVTKSDERNTKESQSAVEQSPPKKPQTSALNSHEQSLISQRQMTHIEDELDLLLALDDDSVSDSKKVSTKSDEQRADDIGDWLDSVLED